MQLVNSQHNSIVLRMKRWIANNLQKLLEAGLDAGIAQWLASSFDGKDFGFDLPVVHDILPEFATQDFYRLLDRILDNGI
jgi:hypothetical protein